MKNLMQTITATTAITILCACSSLIDVKPNNSVADLSVSETHTATIQAPAELRVATWNVEHLAYPIDQGCKPRTEQELEALRAYARKLDVDIVALQEVASKEAVHLLFPEDEWTLVMSARADSQAYKCRGSENLSTQQKTAIAVKKPLAISQVEQNQLFALDNPGLRFGLGLSITSELGDIDILNLHLKSGCFVDDYLQSDTDACHTFSQQAEILYDWINQREKAERAYIILGDFNHRISAPYNRMARTLSHKAKESQWSMQIASASLTGCHPRYPAPIDHIIVGGFTSNQLAFEPKIYNFDDMNEEAMLSDHCAVSVAFNIRNHPLSSAVKWQTQSKEYEIITKGLYKNASANIKNKTKLNQAWVVVMDLDETVLDNSFYQVELDRKGASYRAKTWNDWVKNEKARLVPGVQGFIQTVLAEGGKLVFITNRDKSLDSYTWANIKALTLGLSEQNTCLLGRSEADKNSVKKAKYINDKDLRRESVRKGNPACFSTNKALLSQWQTPHTIVMQLGDNIEDINAVTQDDADINSLLLRLGTEIVILPNPMYGSWL